MDVRFSVTGHTFLGRAPEYFVDMASRTLEGRVLAVQQPDLVVIKISELTTSGMAAHTILAK